jgi:hypothetical protein
MNWLSSGPRRSMWPRRPARCVCGCLASRGRRFSRVWDVPARIGAITKLAEHLMELGIEQVTVEATSDYWRIWYYLLEDAGLDVQLVNSRDVKNVPGRPGCEHQHRCGLVQSKAHAGVAPYRR